METSDWISLLGVLVVAGGLAVALFQLSRQSRQLALLEQQMRSEYEWRLRTSALSYSLAHNAELRDARKKLDKEFGDLYTMKSPISWARLEEAMTQDSDIRTDILHVLSHWENLALAVYTKTVDETVARNMVKGTVRSHVLAFREFIERRIVDNERAYEYLLRLNQEWNKLPELPTWTEFPRVSQ